MMMGCRNQKVKITWGKNTTSKSSLRFDARGGERNVKPLSYTGDTPVQVRSFPGPPLSVHGCTQEHTEHTSQRRKEQARAMTVTSQSVNI